jgi:hypothetical protein
MHFLHTGGCYKNDSYFFTAATKMIAYLTVFLQNRGRMVGLVFKARRQADKAKWDIRVQWGPQPPDTDYV